jgi:dTDP-4-amino-4,6-dideoxyglucose
MHEAIAAMGLMSLDALETILEANRENTQAHRKHLFDIDRIELLEHDRVFESNARYVVARVTRGTTALTQDEVRWVLAAESIPARRHLYPECHGLEPYADQPQNTPLPVLLTEALTDEVLALPTEMTVGPDEITSRGRLVHFAMRNGNAIGRRPVPG